LGTARLAIPRAVGVGKPWRVFTQADSSKTNVAAPRESIGIDMLIARITNQKFVGSSTNDATAAGDSSL
jgi:hypothetical protein